VKFNGINYMPCLFTGVIKMVTHENSTKAVDAIKPTPVAKPVATTPVKASAPRPKVARKAPAKLVTKPAAATPKAVPKATAAAPAKAPAKSTPKPAVKATLKAPVKVAVNSLPKPKVKAAKPAKEKKPKLVRDSFTIPKDEYTVLENLKQRAGKLSTQIKKSELLRAGIKALAAMSDPALLSALKLVPTIKTGRPAKG
jgi:hypothetical protein